MEYSNKLCFICGESDCGGIILNGEKICKACEDRIVNTTVSDSCYDTYRNQVKIILFNQHANE